MEDSFEKLFAQIVVDIRNIQEAEIFLSDALTVTEKIAISQRIAIALFLSQRKSYGEIKKSIKVSSEDIAKVQESLDTPGMRLAIEKLRIDVWASRLARKLAHFLENFTGK